MVRRLPRSWAALLLMISLADEPVLLTAREGSHPLASTAKPLSVAPLPLPAEPPPTSPCSPIATVAPSPPTPFVEPSTSPCEQPLPISLPAALKLANARALDIAVASERLRVAEAQLAQANVLWLPTILVGGDYFRHDGRIQDVTGNNVDTSKGSLMAGAAPIAVFALTDALFAPLAARQVVAARQAGAQAATNDTVLAVAEAYFNVQQARGELAGAIDTTRQAVELERRTKQLAEGLAAPVEATRARVELARRRQAETTARERWRTSSSELARLLRLDAAALVAPLEPPHLRVTLVDPCKTVDELIPLALNSRPELAAQQALVQATLQRLRQEKLRPLIPSILLRGASTNPAGTLGSGVFGAGTNDTLTRFGGRMDLDLEVLWEFRNLGLGNRAVVREREAEHQINVLELFRVQDRIAAEVVQVLAQVQSAAARLTDAEAGLKDALDSVEKNFEGLKQTRRAGNLILLVVRPQEVVAAVQALAQAYSDFYGAVADYNRAQFRLYRALGQPAQLLSECK